MELEPAMLRSMIVRGAERIVANAEELCALDRAIGDGDHGTNMKRGLEAVLAKAEDIVALPVGEALSAIGKTLVMTVGGASGPLYGSFFLAAGAAIGRGRRLPEDLAEVFAAGVEAVGRAAGRRPAKRRCSTCWFPSSTRSGRKPGQADLAVRVEGDGATVHRANGADARHQGTRGLSGATQRRACRSRRAIDLFDRRGHL